MSTDRRARLTRLAAPAGPDGAAARQRWAELDDAQRTRLRRAATDARTARAVDPTDRPVVADLATARARRRAADIVVPAMTGALVLSTVWGFGRAVFADSAAAWLAGGLVGGGLAVWSGLRRARRRRRDAAAVLAAIENRYA